jgi:hypothetical protein
LARWSRGNLLRLAAHNPLAGQSAPLSKLAADKLIAVVASLDREDRGAVVDDRVKPTVALAPLGLGAAALGGLLQVGEQIQRFARLVTDDLPAGVCPDH